MDSIANLARTVLEVFLNDFGWSRYLIGLLLVLVIVAWAGDYIVTKLSKRSWRLIGSSIFNFFKEMRDPPVIRPANASKFGDIVTMIFYYVFAIYFFVFSLPFPIKSIILTLDEGMPFIRLFISVIILMTCWFYLTFLALSMWRVGGKVRRSR